LLQAIEYKPLEEKDLFGLKVSKRALKYLSPAEIRDLYDVFSTFDRKTTGYLKAKELYYALRVLGFTSSETICQELIESDGDPQKYNIFIKHLTYDN
jgi:Ca2+-binding EF-hand superfamily protein